MEQYDVMHCAARHGMPQGGIEQEEDREREYKNADPEKMWLNFSIHVVEDENGEIVRGANGRPNLMEDPELHWSKWSKRERVQRILDKQQDLVVTDKNGRTYTKKATIRKDARTHIDWQFSGSHDTLRTIMDEDLQALKEGKLKNWSESRIHKWAWDNFYWLARQVGVENIVTFNVHCDETTPHIHATVVPMFNGRLNAKKLIGGEDKLKKLRTSHAKEVGEKWGLQRGVEGSRATHTEVHDFYREMKRGDSATLALKMVNYADYTGKSEDMEQAKKYLVSAIPRSIYEADKYLRDNNRLEAQLRDVRGEIDRLQDPEEILNVKLVTDSLFVGDIGLAEQYAHSCGGGGGGGSSSGWGRDKDDDDRMWMLKCIKRAKYMLKPSSAPKQSQGKGLSR